MPAFLNKAQNNIIVAELLLNKNLHSTSAHPAYYSVYLLMKYILAHYMSTSYAAQDDLARSKDSHKVVSQIVLPYLKNVDPKTGNDYFVWYNNLKMMRRKADYRPASIDVMNLSENLDYAKAFMGCVSNHFKAD